jgi:hypothetical protein
MSVAGFLLEELALELPAAPDPQPVTASVAIAPAGSTAGRGFGSPVGDPNGSAAEDAAVAAALARLSTADLRSAGLLDSVLALAARLNPPAPPVVGSGPDQDPPAAEPSITTMTADELVRAALGGLGSD